MDKKELREFYLLAIIKEWKISQEHFILTSDFVFICHYFFSQFRSTKK